MLKEKLNLLLNSQKPITAHNTVIRKETNTSCVKCLYIEKELIPTVWKVFVILITSVLVQINIVIVNSLSLKGYVCV